MSREGDASSGEQTSDRPRGLAGEYLTQALEALHETGDPAALYGVLRGSSASPKLLESMAFVEGTNNRVRASRTTILFSALAAEAYVNEFLAHYLRGSDLKAADRLRPLDKYVLGTKLAVGSAVFNRDEPPAKAIGELFALRNKLVHPKPGYGPPPSPLDAAKEQERTYTPLNAADFLVQVGAAAVVLTKKVRPADLDFPADFVWHGGDVIWAYARRASEGLPKLDDEPQPSLFKQITDRLSGSEGKADEKLRP